MLKRKYRGYPLAKPSYKIFVSFLFCILFGFTFSKNITCRTMIFTWKLQFSLPYYLSSGWKSRLRGCEVAAKPAEKVIGPMVAIVQQSRDMPPYWPDSFARARFHQKIYLPRPTYGIESYHFLTSFLPQCFMKLGYGATLREGEKWRLLWWREKKVLAT